MTLHHLNFFLKLPCLRASWTLSAGRHHNKLVTPGVDDHNIFTTAHLYPHVYCLSNQVTARLIFLVFTKIEKTSHTRHGAFAIRIFILYYNNTLGVHISNLGPRNISVNHPIVAPVNLEWINFRKRWDGWVFSSTEIRAIVPTVSGVHQSAPLRIDVHNKCAEENEIKIDTARSTVYPDAAFRRDDPVECAHVILSLFSSHWVRPSIPICGVHVRTRASASL